MVIIAVPSETESIESYLETTLETRIKDEKIKIIPGIPKYNNGLFNLEILHCDFNLFLLVNIVLSWFFQ